MEESVKKNAKIQNLITNPTTKMYIILNNNNNKLQSMIVSVKLNFIQNLLNAQFGQCPLLVSHPLKSRNYIEGKHFFIRFFSFGFALLVQIIHYLFINLFTWLSPFPNRSVGNNCGSCGFEVDVLVVQT